MGIPSGPPSHDIGLGVPAQVHYPQTILSSSGRKHLIVLQSEHLHLNRCFVYPGLQSCTTLCTHVLPVAGDYNGLLPHYKRFFHLSLAIFYFERWHKPELPMPAAWRKSALDFFLNFQADIEVKNQLHLSPTTIIRIGGAWPSHR